MITIPKNRKKPAYRILSVLLFTAAAVAFLCGLLYLFTSGDRRVPRTAGQDPSLPSVTISGVTYHAETFGDPVNPVIITIHGGPGGDYRSLYPLKNLADEFYVVFFDQRGTGLSPRVDPNGISLESAISDLNAIVEKYGRGRPVNLVGHSWGAMLASAYIGRYPEKVDHLVMAEPGFLTPEEAEKFMAATKIRFSFPLLFHFIRTRFESFHVKKIDGHEPADYFTYHMNLYQGKDHPQAGFRAAGITPSADHGWRNGSGASQAFFREAVDENGKIVIDFRKDAARFTNRILFMTGEYQTIIGEDWQRKQMDYFPNAEIAVIRRAGHEMFSENPDDSIAAVRIYLKGDINERVN